MGFYEKLFCSSHNVYALNLGIPYGSSFFSNFLEKLEGVGKKT